MAEYDCDIDIDRSSVGDPVPDTCCEKLSEVERECDSDIESVIVGDGV